MESATRLQKARRTRMSVHPFVFNDVQLLFRILRLTSPPTEVQETIKQMTQEYAKRGFRTLGKLSLMPFRTLIDASAWRPLRCSM